jgi:hypothetical protein
MIELLIVLALTSITVSFSYTALNYVQRMLKSFNSQNNFIQTYTHIKKVIDYNALKADRIVEVNVNDFVFYGDSISIQFAITETGIVLKKGIQRDSLQIKVEHLTKNYEAMNNTKWQNKLLKNLSLDYQYKKQKFSFCLNKNHDAATKLKLDREE